MSPLTAERLPLGPSRVCAINHAKVLPRGATCSRYIQKIKNTTGTVGRRNRRRRKVKLAELSWGVTARSILYFPPFGGFPDPSFHVTTHRPHSWLPLVRLTVLFLFRPSCGGLDLGLTVLCLSAPSTSDTFLLMASRSSSGTAPKCCTLPISSSLQMEQWPWLPGFRIAFARGTLPSATATHAALFWCLRALGFQLRARVTVAVLQPRPVELVSTALQSAGLFTGCSGFSCAHLALA